MKAVILAAGEGTRLRPFTASEPKVMIPVANKPILHFIVESLVENGITDIIMVVGYKRTRIMSYFGNGEEFGAHIDYVNEEKQLGTAHALLQAKDKVDEQFIVLPGDNIISKSTIKDLLKDLHDNAVLITRSSETAKYGVVSIDDNSVTDVVEMPVKTYNQLISTGIYALQPEVFGYIETLMDERVFDMTSVIRRMLQDREFRGIITESTWMDAVYPWDLIPLNSAALSNLAKTSSGTIEDGVIIKGPVHIGEGTVIKGGCYIEGPVMIGEGCEIGPLSCILPSTSIGSDSMVGPHTVLKNTLVMKGVEIGPNSNLENSVLGDGVNIGSNFSSGVGSRDMIVEGGVKKVKKIGTMIAEDTHIGEGVTVKEGIIIGSKCSVGPGTVVRDDIPSLSRVL